MAGTTAARRDVTVADVVNSLRKNTTGRITVAAIAEKWSTTITMVGTESGQLASEAARENGAERKRPRLRKVRQA